MKSEVVMKRMKIKKMIVIIKVLMKILCIKLFNFKQNCRGKIKLKLKILQSHFYEEFF